MSSVALSLSLAAPLAARRQPRLLELGARVRVTGYGPDGRPTAGTIIRGTPDWLTLRVASPDRRIAFHHNEIARVERSVGCESALGQGLGRGLVGGALAGATIGALADLEHTDIPRGRAIAEVVVVGALAGALLGAVIGSAVRVERWTDVTSNMWDGVGIAGAGGATSGGGGGGISVAMRLRL